MDPFAHNQHSHHALRAWAVRCRRASESALRQTPLGVAPEDRDAGETERWVEAFRDGRGNRRPVDRPLLARVLGLAPTSSVLAVPSAAWLSSTDVSLWWALARGRAVEEEHAHVLAGQGRLLPQLATRGIEDWTEAELCALHALSWAKSPLARARVGSAARWLIDEVQPDNATNRPWAIHVFAALGATGDGEADLYAQTLLHNAVVGTGAAGVDRFSAVILLDAAHWLEAHAGA